MKARFYCAAGLALLSTSVVQASVQSDLIINGKPLTVESITGTGDHESFVAIDFTGDAGASVPKSSYVFEYRWTTAVSGLQMLTDIGFAVIHDPTVPTAAPDVPGKLSFSASDYGGGAIFIDNFRYLNDLGDPNSYWRYSLGTYDNQDVAWTNATGGAGDRMIFDDSFDGWSNSFVDESNPRVPGVFVPEPSAVMFLGGIPLWLASRRKSRARSR